VIFDAADEWTFKAEDSRSKSRNTPFDGASMLGKVRYTICEGRIVYQQ
jgi:dihydroorotase